MTYLITVILCNAGLVLVLFLPWKKPEPTFASTEGLLRREPGGTATGPKWTSRTLRLIGLTPNSHTKLAHDLDLVQSALTMDDIYVYKALCLLGGFALGGMVWLAGDDTIGMVLGCTGFVAFGLPEARVKGQAKRIRAEIDRRLPALLQSLAMMMEAGMNLHPALEAYVDQDQTALGQQLGRAAGEVRLGSPLSESLMRMANRCGVDDLHRTVASLVQASDRGATGLTNTCRDLASQAWAKRRDRARELGQQVSTKMFLPLMALVLPTILLFLLGPAVWDMIHNF